MHGRLQDLHRDGYMENVINYRLWKRIHIILRYLPEVYFKGRC